MNRGLSGNVGGGGGTTITFTDPGGTGQTSLYRKDQNSKHFMNEPSGIAFSMNGNFSTSPGMYDANFSGGSPFTGPALWSSDPLIYAQPSGGNGSHLDMLHASSYAMGIAHETENVFWIFDGNNNDIVRYDFGEDHGPGNSDHDDGKIRQYTGMSVSRINNDIGSHMELDKSSGWLYIVDNGNQRVLRLDVNSGSVGGTPTYGPYETLAEYKNVDGATWEVVVNSGLVEPSGIDVIDDRMIVTDHSSGDIIIYDISSMPAVEIKRIVTGEPGIMGTVIGPEGRIWYVNYQMNKLVKIEPSSIVGPSAITSAQSTDISCNGFSDGTITIVANGPGGSISYSIDGGNTFPDTIGVFTGLNAGSYTVAIQDVNGVLTGSTLIINEPSLLTINSESSTDISSCGATDGSITIVASGGTPNLNYVISDGGMTFSNNSGVFSGLAAGSYLVTMVDANGCTQLGSMLTINEPPGTINIILESSVDISTCGGADGEITIVAAGGTPPLSYSIDGGVSFSNTSGVFTALSVGNYAIAIKDVSGCIQPGSTLSIDEPAAIVIANESATDVTGCLISDGTIIITASDTLGGSLNYSIDGGSTFSNTTGIFTGLSSGTYNIVVRDTNLCSKIGSTIFIDDPSTVTGVLSSSSDSLNTGIGTATVSSVAGGNSPYTYSWSNGGSSATATGLTTGTYTVTVTDASGCTYVDNVFIETTIGVNEYKEAIAEINIYPNPNQGQFKVEIEVPEEVKGISLQITNLLGQNVYFEKIRVPGGNTQISVDLSGYTTGIYYLQVLNEKSLGRTTRKLIIQK
ncbi:MAG: T9SS type A sorting domain-containing protein [Flavobacteriales bacterium]|nr:T9SS type A sorting domain-containing protein [Flavobacteriales bacterium]